MEIGEIMVAVLEYVPSQSRIVMRGCFPQKSFAPLARLTPDSVQNNVHIFAGVDMKSTGVFSGLQLVEQEEYEREILICTCSTEM